MQRLVVDTNVVVSGLIGKGPPRQILERILSGSVALILSKPVFQEYVEVLSRPKFARHNDFFRNAKVVLQSLHGLASFIEPTQRITVCTDSDDNKFVELAVGGGAEFLVTGNLRHFPSSPFRGVLIVSPAQILSNLRADRGQ